MKDGVELDEDELDSFEENILGAADVAEIKDAKGL